MRPEQYPSCLLLRFLRHRRMATLDALKSALGTRVDMTVFRKLREIPYCSSYSHGGRYYALLENADFDERGLWSVRDVRFSRFGSLVDTSAHFVERSERGLLASELRCELEVDVKAPLLTLVRRGELAWRRGRDVRGMSRSNRDNRGDSGQGPEENVLDGVWHVYGAALQRHSSVRLRPQPALTGWALRRFLAAPS